MRERKNGVIEWTMRHYQITLLVITVLVGLGIWGLVDMPKQEFPEFTIRQGVVDLMPMAAFTATATTS